MPVKTPVVTVTVMVMVMVTVMEMEMEMGMIRKTGHVVSWAADALATLRDHQRDIRGLYSALQAELVSLRRVLALEIGTTHPDYQKLRFARASASDEEDDLPPPVGDPDGEDQPDPLDEALQPTG